jgi:hypothetical protein
VGKRCIRNFGGKPERKIILGTGWEGVDWIHLFRTRPSDEIL